MKMEIDPNPPGLIGRRFFPIDQGRWVMEEEWNIETPGCPLIRSPWLRRSLHDGPIFIRQVVMTSSEYEKAAKFSVGQSTSEK